MDWGCYRSLLPDGYSLFLDEDLSEPRRGIPSVALTAGSGCCFATDVVFLDVLASIRSRDWPTSIGDSRPHSYPCVPPLPPQIISRGARFSLVVSGRFFCQLFRPSHETSIHLICIFPHKNLQHQPPLLCIKNWSLTESHCWYGVVSLVALHPLPGTHIILS